MSILVPEDLEAISTVIEIDRDMLEVFRFLYSTKISESIEYSSVKEKYIIPVISVFHGFYNVNDIIKELSPSKLEYTVDKLKEILPNIRNIRVKDDIIYIIYTAGNEYFSIPLDILGDGYKVFIMFTIFHILGAKAILVEEPEILMHPGLLDRYTYELIRLIKNTDINYFASTHSLEFIEFLLEHALESDLLDFISIFRVYRIDDLVDIEPISGREAYEYIDKIKHDLRRI